MTKARDLANASTALSAVSATELAFLDGVTSAVQTQIDAKAASSTAATLTGTQTLTNKTLTNPVIASVINNTLTSTTGDIIYASGANTPARLGIGSSAQVLTVASGVPSWATPSSGGMTLLSTTTLTGTTTTISSISQSYNDLLINVYGMVAGSTQDVWAGMNGYSGFSQAVWGNGTGNTSGTKASEQQWVSDGTNYFTTGQWFIYIPNYASTANKKIASFNGFYGTQTCISGTYTSDDASAVTAIYMKCPQTFSAGTVKIWGVK